MDIMKEPLSVEINEISPCHGCKLNNCLHDDCEKRQIFLKIRKYLIDIENKEEETKERKK